MRDEAIKAVSAVMVYERLVFIAYQRDRIGRVQPIGGGAIGDFLQSETGRACWPRNQKSATGWRNR